VIAKAKKANETIRALKALKVIVEPWSEAKREIEEIRGLIEIVEDGDRESLSHIEDEIRKLGGEALDMCCGSGGITLQTAPYFDKVTGVDISEKNIEDALLNAKNNKINNVEFICDDAESFLLSRKGSKEIEKFSAIILDPPRAGLSKKAKEAVSSSGVENIVYVSCNPVNLAEDLKTLTTAYGIEKIIPVDMFPHTRHVEVVAILKRNKV